MSRADRVTIVVGVALIVPLYAARLHSYVLFHTLAEIIFIVVCLSVVVMAWTLREFLDDDFAVFLAAALCAVAALHLVHVVDYPSLGLISGSLDPPTQLWLAARFLLAGSLIAGAFVIGRRVNMALVGAVCVVYVLLTLASIYWWHIFPATLGVAGLTPFKKVAEYVICAMLVIAGVLLWGRRDRLPGGTWRLLRAALVASVIAELWFTVYHFTATWPNMLGHFFLVGSALLIFRAVVDDGLARPHSLTVHDLREAELVHRRLERGLMPSLPLEREGIDVVSQYRSGERHLDLSGDFIDVIDRGADGVAVICGDVSGHGANAAALGAMLRASWQALCASGVDAVTMVRSLRAVLERERGDPLSYATLCLAWLDPAARTIRLLNMGHPVPLLVAGDAVVALPAAPIPPLGTVEWPVEEPQEIELPEGWGLFFYTDGLIEARVAPDASERYGELRLIDAVRRHFCGPADVDLGAMLEEVESAGGEPFIDDVTVIFISQAAARVAAPAG